MLNVIRRAIRLDVVELLPEFSDPDLLDQRYVKPQQGWQRLLNRSRIARTVMFFRRMATTFRSPAGTTADPADAVLMATFTVNQRRALEPVHSCLQKRNVRTCFVDGAQKGGPFQRLLRSSFLWALPFFPLVLLRMFTTRGYQWKSFLWAFDRYWQAYGAYVAARRWYRRQLPRALVVSNDHSFWPRILVVAAKDQGIPTIYLQHAPITDRFPPLAMDFALLDGEHSLSLYAKIDQSSTRVYLVGMPRMDAHVCNVNQNTQAHAVGFCLGQADSLERATELLRYLTENCAGLRFIVRLHPRSSPKVVSHWKNICRELGTDFSDSHTENPFEFISRVDVVIAGGSGIILEATLLNVTPIMYTLTPDRPDWYGFSRDGLCPLIATPEEATKMLNELHEHRPPVRGRAKSYCATIDTDYAGRSTELAADLVQQISERGAPDTTSWQHLENTGSLVAYEIKSAT